MPSHWKDIVFLFQSDVRNLTPSPDVMSGYPTTATTWTFLALQTHNPSSILKNCGIRL